MGIALRECGWQDAIAATENVTEHAAIDRLDIYKINVI
jgi:hypothetical protein